MQWNRKMKLKSWETITKWYKSSSRWPRRWFRCSRRRHRRTKPFQGRAVAVHNSWSNRIWTTIKKHVSNIRMFSLARDISVQLTIVACALALLTRWSSTWILMVNAMSEISCTDKLNIFIWYKLYAYLLLKNISSLSLSTTALFSATSA